MGATELPRHLAEEMTMLGHLDMRLRLDQDITPSNPKYTASLSMMASELSYEHGDLVRYVITHHWKMENPCVLDLWNEDNQDQRTTHAIMFNDKSANLIVVAFRGTSPLDADAWITDINLEWYTLQGTSNTHRDFMKALGLKGPDWPKPDNVTDTHYFAQQPAYYEITKRLRDQLLLDPEGETMFIVTGHSLGGALAILFVGLLAYHDDTWLMKRLEGVYTFGQPGVGDMEFTESMNRKIKEHGLKYLRYVYCNDIVPRLHFDNRTFRSRHFGRCLYLNSCHRGWIVKEEPNKNYFPWKWLVPKFFNSYWELIRGFTIHYRRGKEYKEGWFLILLRLLGLVFPGLSAHSPQDYVNVTQLGMLPSNLQNIIRQAS
ncbi:unnamed protein product [Camellia sinensis]